MLLKKLLIKDDYHESLSKQMCTLGGLRIDSSFQLYARNLLALAATSVPSERAFSKAGHIVCRRRARLTPSHVDELVFLSHNYRQLITVKPSGFIVQSESENSIVARITVKKSVLVFLVLFCLACLHL